MLEDKQVKQAKSVITAMGSLKNIKYLQSIKKGFAEEISKLKESKVRVQQEQKAEKASFIREALQNFLDDMDKTWDRRKYISGGYSSEFTRFVSRGNMWHYAISEKHGDAVRIFNDAKEELNEIFVQELQKCAPEKLDHLAHNWGLKNLTD